MRPARDFAVKLSSILQHLYLPLAAAFAFGGFLALGHATPSRASASDATAGRGIVWVYYTSLCAAPGDSSDCKQVSVPARRSFPSLEACSAFRNVDLSQNHNPRLLGSCLRQREA
jgi:hypothetical protein